jgi:predicted RNA-binding protein with PUA-like domain
MNKMGKLSAIERQYWLWVTRPKYYLDENGADREDLDPNQTPDAGWWWTCHKDTRRGDLVLVWRTTPKKDIGYLIQTKSDAYSIKGDKDAVQHGWQWGCDYQVLYKFKYPVTIQDLRNDPHLQGWSPLKAKFRGRASAFRIMPEDWERLNLLASHKNPGYEVFLKELEGTIVVKSIRDEECLRKKLIENLGALKPFGYDLKLYVEPGTGRTGREFVLKGHGGRIDCCARTRNNLTLS